MPELALTPDILNEIQPAIGAWSESALVIAGSFHGLDGQEQANLAVGLLTGVDETLGHRKLVPFTDELSFSRRATKEGITPGRKLVLYQAGPLRLGLAICKDCLDPDIVQLLAQLGVNLLCVPALSRKTGDFPSRAHQFVSDTQGFVIVANGPLEWDGDLVSPSL